ncbi:N-acylneuraminate cytidylyltransferase [Haloimpatiens massiliensis]|uniref:N-acylneuraminate cytidylyltransferase n=1 Tax=Haloimpatiens massiliensis TaxID=1658110 RepID=UPI000C836912|nr:N-acylneuraminate cytidylyltransferase [Haloimpatiens massiliensis]
MNIAFIPVRGGSKSIPLKNIKQINGRPLICWVLDAAINCNKIDEVIVSTDSLKIKNVVQDYYNDKVKVVSRSAEVSTDIASTESVMLEFAKDYKFDNIVLIQATSPLLTSTDLDKGFKEFSKNGIDSVLSVVRQKRFIWNKSKYNYEPYNYDYLKRPRRQEFDGFLVENGAFYITTKESLLRSNCRISGNISCVEMGEETYFEIDELSDWLIIEQLLKERSKKICDIDVSKIKILLTDSDGVLTDGGMYYSENGDELKKFNTKDGMAFKLLKEKGIKTGIITGENISLVQRRAEKLRVDEIHLGIKNKLECIDKICHKYNVNYDEIAYIGDDINDLDVIKKVGLGCSVADGMECVKAVAKYTCKSKGGQGAVREVAEYILNYKK